MKYTTTMSAASRRPGSCIIVGIYENCTLGVAAADIDHASNGLVKRQIKSGDLSGKLGHARLLLNLDGVRAERVLVVGLGKIGSLGISQFRKAMVAATKVLVSRKITDASIYLTLEEITGVSPYYLARYSVQAVGESLYRYTATKSKRHASSPLKRLTLVLRKKGDLRQVVQGTKHADAIVEGMALAKDLSNLPANICTPSYLARTARRLDRENRNIRTRVIGEAGMKKLGMHSLLSVTAGSALPAKLVVMNYKGTANQAPIVLVGKGVTFDSGGISLKASAGMEAMKFDMGGAAAVIATIAIVAKLQLPINLIVIVAACENMPGAAAMRPGDIVTSMSGQTIEIVNTDAEGRLMLCDALTYARRFKPATVIDVATLTGAVVVALGSHYTAVMSNNDELADGIIDAGYAADDRGWRMPMGMEYEHQLKSNFADFTNVAEGRDGGAIVAACFLSKFTEDMEWAHLDVGGTAWPSGAKKDSTGRPVPMLTEYLLRRAGALL